MTPAEDRTLIPDMDVHNHRRGQGMVEYIIMVVVVGIFCIGIFMALGKGVQHQTSVSTEKLAGVRAHNGTTLADEEFVELRSVHEAQRSNLMTGE